MPKPPVPPEIDTFLTAPNPSVIAVSKPDGAPLSTATWYLWEGGRVLVNLDLGRKRLDYMRADPRVSITVLGKDDWYHQVSLRGRVVSIEDDSDRSDIDRIAMHYMGRPYSDREGGRVSAWIEVDAWHGWAGGGPWDPASS